MSRLFYYVLSWQICPSNNFPALIYDLILTISTAKPNPNQQYYSLIKNIIKNIFSYCLNRHSILTFSSFPNGYQLAIFPNGYQLIIVLIYLQFYFPIYVFNFNKMKLKLSRGMIKAVPLIKSTKNKNH